jgi:diacylglycerol kinase (ATP)
VIVNPTAGNGKVARLVPWVARRLRPMGDAELVTTRSPGHGIELARGAAADGRRRIVAVGGDGTVQEVASGLLSAGTPADALPVLGILARGRGNDLARSIGLPRRLEAAWTVAIGAPPAPLDVGRVRLAGGAVRHFVSCGGIGFDAQVAAVMARRGRSRTGAIGYLLATLAELRRFRNVEVEVSLDDDPPERSRVLLVALANGAYYGGGMRICPDARTDDGRLDLCFVGDISRLTALRQLPNLYRGTHLRHPVVSIRHARRVRVDGDASVRVHLDGEPAGGLPIEVELTPAALRVAAPVAEGR